MNLFVLAALVTGAFAVEAAVGFGSTVVILTLGALILPLDALMTVVVPVNMALSAIVLARDWREAELRFLGARILPAMLVGMVVGLLAARGANLRALELAYAVFVIALAGLELVRRRAPSAPSRPATLGWLAAGGVAHGAFAASGPLVVWIVSRAVPGKRAFRATLAALWLLVNGAWLLGALARGALHRASFVTSLELLPAMALGLLVGDAVHTRLAPERFRRAVFGLMLGAGLVLLAATA